MLTDFNPTLQVAVDLESRADLSKLLIELQNLLEQRKDLETKE